MNRPAHIAGAVFTLALCTVFAAGELSAHAAFDARVEQLNQAIAAAPENAELYFKRGDLHRRHKKFARAYVDFDRAHQLAPRAAEFYLLQGRAKLDEGRASEAIPDLSRFLALYPESTSALNIRADAYAANNQITNAIADLDHALATANVRTPELYLKRARWQVEAKQIQAARIGLDRALDDIGPIVSLLRLAIELDLHEDDYDRALARLDALPVAQQNSATWLVTRGRILRDAGNGEAAAIAYTRAQNVITELPLSRRANRANQTLLAEIETELNKLTN